MCEFVRLVDINVLYLVSELTPFPLDQSGGRGAVLFGDISVRRVRVRILLALFGESASYQYPG